MAQTDVKSLIASRPMTIFQIAVSVLVIALNVRRGARHRIQRPGHRHGYRLDPAGAAG